MPSRYTVIPGLTVPTSDRSYLRPFLPPTVPTSDRSSQTRPVMPIPSFPA